MLRAYEAGELEGMETLEDGDYQLLKVEAPGFRVWLCLVNFQPEYEIRIGDEWYELSPTVDGNWLINT